MDGGEVRVRWGECAHHAGVGGESVARDTDTNQQEGDEDDEGDYDSSDRSTDSEWESGLTRDTGTFDADALNPRHCCSEKEAKTGS